MVTTRRGTSTEPEPVSTYTGPVTRKRSRSASVEPTPAPVPSRTRRGTSPSVPLPTTRTTTTNRRRKSPSPALALLSAPVATTSTSTVNAGRRIIRGRVMEGIEEESPSFNRIQTRFDEKEDEEDEETEADQGLRSGAKKRRTTPETDAEVAAALLGSYAAPSIVSASAPAPHPAPVISPPVTAPAPEPVPVIAAEVDPSRAPPSIPEDRPTPTPAPAPAPVVAPTPSAKIRFPKIDWPGFDAFFPPKSKKSAQATPAPEPAVPAPTATPAPASVPAMEVPVASAETPVAAEEVAPAPSPAPTPAPALAPLTAPASVAAQEVPVEAPDVPAGSTVPAPTTEASGTAVDAPVTPPTADADADPTPTGSSVAGDASAGPAQAAGSAAAPVQTDWYTDLVSCSGAEFAAKLEALRERVERGEGPPPGWELNGWAQSFFPSDTPPPSPPRSLSAPGATGDRDFLTLANADFQQRRPSVPIEDKDTSAEAVASPPRPTGDRQRDQPSEEARPDSPPHAPATQPAEGQPRQELDTEAASPRESEGEAASPKESGAEAASSRAPSVRDPSPFPDSDDEGNPPGQPPPGSVFSVGHQLGAPRRTSEDGTNDDCHPLVPVTLEADQEWRRKLQIEEDERIRKKAGPKLMTDAEWVQLRARRGEDGAEARYGHKYQFRTGQYSDSEEEDDVDVAPEVRRTRKALAEIIKKHNNGIARTPLDVQLDVNPWAAKSEGRKGLRKSDKKRCKALLEAAGRKTKGKKGRRPTGAALWLSNGTMRRQDRKIVRHWHSMVHDPPTDAHNPKHPDLMPSSIDPILLLNALRSQTMYEEQENLVKLSETFGFQIPSSGREPSKQTPPADPVASSSHRAPSPTPSEADSVVSKGSEHPLVENNPALKRWVRPYEGKSHVEAVQKDLRQYEGWHDGFAADHDFWAATEYQWLPTVTSVPHLSQQLRSDYDPAAHPPELIGKLRAKRAVPNVVDPLAYRLRTEQHPRGGPLQGIDPKTNPFEGLGPPPAVGFRFDGHKPPSIHGKVPAEAVEIEVPGGVRGDVAYRPPMPALDSEVWQQYDTASADGTARWLDQRHNFVVAYDVMVEQIKTHFGGADLNKLGNPTSREYAMLQEGRHLVAYGSAGSTLSTQEIQHRSMLVYADQTVRAMYADLRKKLEAERLSAWEAQDVLSVALGAGNEEALKRPVAGGQAPKPPSIASVPFRPITMDLYQRLRAEIYGNGPPVENLGPPQPPPPPPPVAPAPTSAADQAHLERSQRGNESNGSVAGQPDLHRCSLRTDGGTEEPQEEQEVAGEERGREVETAQPDEEDAYHSQEEIMQDVAEVDDDCTPIKRLHKGKGRAQPNRLLEALSARTPTATVDTGTGISDRLGTEGGSDPATADPAAAHAPVPVAVSAAVTAPAPADADTGDARRRLPFPKPKTLAPVREMVETPTVPVTTDPAPAVPIVPAEASTLTVTAASQTTNGSSTSPIAMPAVSAEITGPQPFSPQWATSINATWAPSVSVWSGWYSPVPQPETARPGPCLAHLPLPRFNSGSPEDTADLSPAASSPGFSSGVQGHPA